MHRRSFLAGSAAGSSLGVLAARAAPRSGMSPAGWRAFAADEVAGLQPLAQFEATGGLWSVYERRDGQAAKLWFLSPDRRMLGLPRWLEACGAGDTPFYAGLDFRTVALSGPDLLGGHGATSVGVVANIGPPDAQSRDLLGFISYGYARALLRQDRIPEYLLFLYAHRHHLHAPGSWTAAEVAG